LSTEAWFPDGNWTATPTYEQNWNELALHVYSNTTHNCDTKFSFHYSEQWIEWSLKNGGVAVKTEYLYNEAAGVLIGPTSRPSKENSAEIIICKKDCVGWTLRARGRQYQKGYHLHGIDIHGEICCRIKFPGASSSGLKL
jgi:hypothetical protein